MNSDNPNDTMWQAVTSRNKRADGSFVYAVRTTGIFCRPSCSSRRPNRENVEFFAVPALAQDAGYRPCLRCHPQQAVIADQRLLLVQKVCDYIHENADQPSSLTLEHLATDVHYAPRRVFDVFTAVLGITPHQYAESLRVKKLKDQLRGASSVTQAIYNAGYNWSSGVYEHADATLGMTPAQYADQGSGVAISYTVANCFLGALLIAVTPRGICAVGIYDNAVQAEAALRAEYPQAECARDDTHLKHIVDAILGHVQGNHTALDLPLDIQATAFQFKVWNLLRQIPHGQTRTYSQIALELGQPSAVRAVANACANNKAAIVIPCHRVIGKDGKLTGYKWGVARKKLLLETESSTA